MKKNLSESLNLKIVRHNCTGMFEEVVRNGTMDAAEENAYGEQMVHIAARVGNLNVSVCIFR